MLGWVSMAPTRDGTSPNVIRLRTGGSDSPVFFQLLGIWSEHGTEIILCFSFCFPDQHNRKFSFAIWYVMLHFPKFATILRLKRVNFASGRRVNKSFDLPALVEQIRYFSNQPDFMSPLSYAADNLTYIREKSISGMFIVLRWAFQHVCRAVKKIILSLSNESRIIKADHIQLEESEFPPVRVEADAIRKQATTKWKARSAAKEIPKCTSDRNSIKLIKCTMPCS